MRTPVVLCAVALLSSACGQQPASPSGAQSPLSPSPVALVQPANFAGEWQVTYHVDSCIGRYCYISHINRDEQLTLRLLQIGDRVSGVMLKGLAIDVEGRVDADGRLSLTGGAPSTVREVPGLELLRFEAALDPAAGLQGALQYQSLIPGDHSAYSTGATGPIVRAIRAPFSAITSFSGTWRGHYDMNACSAALGCLLDLNGDLEFTLEERGGQVTGTLVTYPAVRAALSGTVSGDTAVLTGSASSLAITSLQIRRTPAGRLLGTASLRGGAGWTAELELRGVALAP